MTHAEATARARELAAQCKDRTMTETPIAPQELKPCPFCGGDEISLGYSSPGVDGSTDTGEVQCHSCDVVLWRSTEAEAIAAWNTRPQGEAAATVHIKERWAVTRDFVEAEPIGATFAKAVPQWAHSLGFCGYADMGWSAVDDSGRKVASGKWGDELWLMENGTFACPEYPNGYSHEAAIEKGRIKWEQEQASLANPEPAAAPQDDLEAKFRCFLSHATGGRTDDITLPLNTMSVMATQKINEVWQAALEKGRKEAAAPQPIEECTIPPEGWRCTRAKGHEGPCAAIQATDDKLVDLIRSWLLSEDHPVSKWEQDFAAAIRAYALPAPQPQARELVDLVELHDRLQSGVFYGDYDEDCRLLGVFGKYLAALTPAAQAEPASGVVAFAEAILHGDDTHRDWLREAAECWTAGKPIPEPRSNALTTITAADSDWQPIETAPKDGEWFIAMQDGEEYPCAWETEEPDEGSPQSGWFDFFNRSFEGPTHWRPRKARTAVDTEGEKA